MAQREMQSLANRPRKTIQIRGDECIPCPNGGVQESGETANPQPCARGEGLREPPFLHPPLDFIAFSCNTDPTHPSAAPQVNRPLLEAPLPVLQRKSVMSSGRFSQLPAPP